MSARCSAVIKKANSVGNEEERNGEQLREQREVAVQLPKSVQVWFPALQKAVIALESVQKRVTGMVKGTMEWVSL